jgi:hypothetical protein
VIGQDTDFARLNQELHADIKLGSMLYTDEASPYKSVRASSVSRSTTVLSNM